MAYVEVTVSGYNASPPPDDGSVTASNEVTWAGIKTKIGDPIKTAFDTCQANITSVVSTEIEVNLYAPPTTAALFCQTAAPTLWTKSVTHNDKMLRVVSGTASSGGTTGLSALSAAAISAHTLTSAEIPGHTHSFSGTTDGHTHGVGTFAVGITDPGHAHTYNEPSTGGGGSAFNIQTGTNSHTNDSHNTNTVTTGITGALSGSSASATDTVSGTTGSTGSGGSHSHTWGISPAYVDAIIATKD